MKKIFITLSIIAVLVGCGVLGTQSMPDQRFCDDWRAITFVVKDGGHKIYNTKLCVLAIDKIKRPTDETQLGIKYSWKKFKPNKN